MLDRCGEFNSPSFFLTYRSDALRGKPARQCLAVPVSLTARIQKRALGYLSHSGTWTSMTRPCD